MKIIISKSSLGSSITRNTVATAFSIAFAALTGLGQVAADPEVRPLTTGQKTERAIKGAETHLYSVSLKQGDALRVDLREKGANVGISVKNAEQKEVFEYDLGEGSDLERFTFIIERSSSYILAVRSAPGQNGSYDLSITAGPANAADLQNAAAAGLNKEAVTFVRKGTGEAMMQAIAKWEQALKIFSETGEIYYEAEIRGNLGTLYSMLGQKPKALEYREKALALNEKMGDKKNIARNLTGIATIYAQTGAKQKAIEYFERSLPLIRAAGDRRDEAIILNNIGTFYSQLGDNRGALDSYGRAIAVAETIVDKNVQASMLALIYAGIGLSDNALGEHAKALDYFQRSSILAKATGDIRTQATVVNGIAVANGALGDHQKSLDAFRQASALHKSVGNKAGEAGALSNIGEVYSLLGEKQKALDTNQQALELARAINNKEIESTALHNIARVYDELGDSEQALIFLERALPITRTAGLKDIESNVLNSLGKVYESRGDLDKSAEALQNALAISKETGRRYAEAAVYTNLSNHYALKNDFTRSLEFAQQAYELAKTINKPDIEAYALNNIGAGNGELGDPQKASEYLARAMAVARRVGDRHIEARSESNLMANWKRQDSMRLAIFFGKQSFNNLQILRSNVRNLDKNLQQSFLKTIEQVYRRLADALIKQKRLAEAQYVLNAFKDQQVFDFSQVKQFNPIAVTRREAELTATLNLKLENLVTAVRDLDSFKLGLGERAPSAVETERLKSLADKQSTANSDYFGFLKSIEQEFAAPLDEKDKAPDVTDLTQMQASLRETAGKTKQNTVAVYQLVGEYNYHALIITPDTIRSVSTPMQGAQLNEKAKQFWALLQSDEYDPKMLGKELYDAVFKPIETELPRDTKTILWSLDGNLRYVPMAALYDGRRYLVERYNHVSFTRADRERMNRAVSSVWTGTGFGSTRAQTISLLGEKISFSSLPGVDAELAAIFKQPGSRSGILNGTVLPDEKFTKVAMLSALSEKRPLVHITSHFSFRPGDESRSFLLLGDGSAFTLEEMKKQTDLFAGVELLTLSACNTAANQANANGREVDAFAELAQRLGASAVMATLWPVADNSTPTLMKVFYTAREGKNGMSKAHALRQAQLELLNGTVKSKVLPLSDTRASKTSSVKVEITKNNTTPRPHVTRGDIVYISETDAPLYKEDRKTPFAHPHYWAPFILIGNWR